MDDWAMSLDASSVPWPPTPAMTSLKTPNQGLSKWIASKGHTWAQTLQPVHVAESTQAFPDFSLHAREGHPNWLKQILHPLQSSSSTT